LTGVGFDKCGGNQQLADEDILPKPSGS
jgi:hypothetical protein